MRLILISIFLALSELSIGHAALEPQTEWNADTFESIKSLEDNALQKMYESGVADPSAPVKSILTLMFYYYEVYFLAIVVVSSKCEISKEFDHFIVSFAVCCR